MIILDFNKDKIYYGADDNASGVSALIAISSHFTKIKPHNNLLIIATDGEESGFLGAAAFLNQISILKKKKRLY